MFNILRFASLNNVIQLPTYIFLSTLICSTTQTKLDLVLADITFVRRANCLTRDELIKYFSNEYAIFCLHPVQVVVFLTSGHSQCLWSQLSCTRDSLALNRLEPKEDMLASIESRFEVQLKDVNSRRWRHW